jgi:hypothetical protein
MSSGVLQRKEMSSLPAGRLLFDTGIYIRFSRGEKYLWLGEDARIFQRTILTAVVAAELYAGTHSQQEKRALDELCQAHSALGHFSSPPGSAWIDTGILQAAESLAHDQRENSHCVSSKSGYRRDQREKLTDGLVLEST